MNCKNIENKIIDYIDNELSVEEKTSIKNHIATCTSCKKVYDETKELLTAFSNEPVMYPTANLSSSFNKMLEEEKQSQPKVIHLNQKKKKSYKSLMQIAASVVILMTGYLLGGYNQNTSSENQHMILAMANESSPSERIKAVNYTEELTTPDSSILKALIERMQKDSNSNVRLTAVEALSKFTDSELVKVSLIETLSIETDPTIQIEIIQILVDIQEKRALNPMKKLLEQPELPNYLIAHVNSSIAQLV